MSAKMKASLFENLFLESRSVECETEDYIYSGVCGDLDNIGYDRRECAPCAEKYSVGEIVSDAGDYKRGDKCDEIILSFCEVNGKTMSDFIITVAMTHIGAVSASASPAPTAAAAIA